MVELLRGSMEYAVSREVLQAFRMDLDARTTSPIPAGSNDLGTTGYVNRTLLAEAEDPPRLADKTIHRHARECNPSEEV